VAPVDHDHSLNTFMPTGDTIVANSSPAAPSARIILRSSGPHAHSAACALASLSTLAPATAHRAELRFAELIVPATL
jgi:tRNA U34 5-carboxymethylaminomethyl modifying GTPase MnmE/TrmE